MTSETFDHSAVAEWQNSTNEYLVTVCLSFFRIYRTPVFPESTSCILWPKNFISSVGSFISAKDIYIHEGYLYYTTSFIETIYLCIQNIQIFIYARMQVIIGPRYTWGPIYGSESLKLTHRRFWNFTELTLANEDTNSILTDNANRAIQGNVATN